MITMTDTTYHPTRFDSARDEVVGILSSASEGYGTAESGDVEAPTGFFALVLLDQSCDLDVQDTTGAYPIGDEAGEVARTYGVTAEDIKGSWIVTTNSQGFYDVVRFNTAGEAREAFDCAEARYAEWNDEDRDEDSDGVYVCPVIGHGYHSL